MKRLILLLLLLPLSQLALARVYMCVDQQTGKTSFTDKACAETASVEQVQVREANTGKSPKVWNSHRDKRKSGRDYNDQRRELYQNKASASADSQMQGS